MISIESLRSGKCGSEPEDTCLAASLITSSSLEGL